MAIKFPLGSKKIFQCISGSHLYGTATELSDVDERGIFIPPKEYFLGFSKKIEQIEDKKNDIVYWNIRKFLQLAADCNPAMVELLFIPDNKWIVSSKEWKTVVSNKESFISKKARFTFAGYAMSQANRIKRHRSWLLNPPKNKPERKDFGLPEDRTLVQSDQIGAFNVLLSMYLEQVKQFHPLKEQLDEMLETKQFIGIIQSYKDMNMDLVKYILPVSDNLIEALSKEKRYIQAKLEWDKYQKWKTERNPERAKLEEKFGFDCYSDEETEFLTENGWKKFDNIGIDENLVTLNQTTGKTELQKPIERIDKIFNGTMYDIETEQLNCLVTPNHRMYVSPCCRSSINNFFNKYVDGKWIFVKADDILNGIKINDIGQRKTNFNYYINPSIKEIDTPIPNIENITGNDLLRLIGIYIADGSLRINKNKTKENSKYIRISHLKGNRKDIFISKYLKTILNEYEYFRKDKQKIEKIWTSPSKILGNWISINCGLGARNKKLPLFAKNLSTQQSWVLLEALLCGDGYDRGENASYIYYTYSSQLANDIQELCVHTGITCQIWGPYKNCFHVYIKKPEHETQFGMLSKRHIKPKVVKNYRIVCFTVPNELLITRRGGKIAIQGNTKHGSHLYRLLSEGEELLLKHTITLPRPDAELLLEIRNGKYSYEELMEMIGDVDLKFGKLYQETTLPKTPSLSKIDNMCIDIVENWLSSE